MSYYDKDIGEQDDEVDDCVKALDYSDVDDVENHLNLFNHTESEEYSDDDAIYQPSTALQPSSNMNSNITGHKKEFIQSRTEESEEYSDDENIYRSKIVATDSMCTKKMSPEQWIFVQKETDCRPECLPDFNEQSGPTFTIPTHPVPSDFYQKMLPDSLFDYIAECTNRRAKLHFTNIVKNNENNWIEVTCNEMKKFVATCKHITKRQLSYLKSLH